MNTGTDQSLAHTCATSLGEETLLTLEDWREDVASKVTTESYWDWVQKHLPGSCSRQAQNR
jgi:hypothetical protein